MQNLRNQLANDLKQRALLLATEIYKEEFNKLELEIIVVKRDSVPYVKQVFDRAKTYSGIKCPFCWVKYEKEANLILKKPNRGDVEHYKCMNCDFNHYCSKAII